MRVALVAGLLVAAMFAAAPRAAGGGAPVYVPGSALGWPVAAATITQPFGCTDFELEPFEPDCPSRHWHSGVDLAVAEGTPVRAAAAGVVRQSGWSAGGYGNRVVVDHGSGYATLYAHLDAVEVTPGQRVAPGDELGLAGSTGNSTGPHVHFEVRVDGRPRDPLTYIAGERARSDARGEML